jgi:hypothetical protein
LIIRPIASATAEGLDPIEGSDELDEPVTELAESLPRERS